MVAGEVGVDGDLALATTQLELELWEGQDPATVLHLRVAAGSFDLIFQATLKLKVLETTINN